MYTYSHISAHIDWKFIEKNGKRRLGKVNNVMIMIKSTRLSFNSDLILTGVWLDLWRDYRQAEQLEMENSS